MDRTRTRETAQRQDIDHININLAALETLPPADVNPDAYVYYLDPEAPAGRNWYKIKVSSLVSAGGGLLDVISDSLDVSTPVVNQRKVEIKVIPITRAAFRTGVSGQTLLPGVTYRITDPIAPLTSLNINVGSAGHYFPQMTAFVNNGTSLVEVACSYDPVADKNTMIYYAPLNNLVVANTVDNKNCLVNFNPTRPQFKNCRIINSNISVHATRTILNGLVCESDVLLSLDRTTINGTTVGAGTQLSVGLNAQFNITRTQIGKGTFFSFNGDAATGQFVDSVLTNQNGLGLITDKTFSNVVFANDYSNYGMVINPDGVGKIDLQADLNNGSAMVGTIFVNSNAFPLKRIDNLTTSNEFRRPVKICPSVLLEVQDQTIGGGNIVLQGAGIIMVDGLKDDHLTFWSGPNSAKSIMLDGAIH